MSFKTILTRTHLHRVLHRRFRGIEYLEPRLLLSSTPWDNLESRKLSGPVPPAVLTTLLPDGVSRADFAEQLGPYAAAKPIRSSDPEPALAEFINVTEAEPPGTSGLNDTPKTAEFIKEFGTGVNEDPEAVVFGDLFKPPPPSLLPPPLEDDGSIPRANPTGLVSGKSALTKGTIGDGPHGSKGTGTGDFDFFKISGVKADQTITVDVDIPKPDSKLDSFCCSLG